MATLAELKQNLQDVADGVATLAQAIKDLKDAGVGAVTQAQLDDLNAQAETIETAIADAQA